MSLSLSKISRLQQNTFKTPEILLDGSNNFSDTSLYVVSDEF